MYGKSKITKEENVIIENVIKEVSKSDCVIMGEFIRLGLRTKFVCI